MFAQLTEEQIDSLFLLLKARKAHRAATRRVAKLELAIKMFRLEGRTGEEVQEGKAELALARIHEKRAQNWAITAQNDAAQAGVGIEEILDPDGALRYNGAIIRAKSVLWPKGDSVRTDETGEEPEELK